MICIASISLILTVCFLNRNALIRSSPALNRLLKLFLS